VKGVSKKIDDDMAVVPLTDAGETLLPSSQMSKTGKKGALRMDSELSGKIAHEKEQSKCACVLF
jgi:hypothetical protein